MYDPGKDSLCDRLEDWCHICSAAGKIIISAICSRRYTGTFIGQRISIKPDISDVPQQLFSKIQVQRVRVWDTFHPSAGIQQSLVSLGFVALTRIVNPFAGT